MKVGGAGLARALGAVLLVIVVVVAGAWAVSEWRLSRTDPVVVRVPTLPDDSVDIAEGGRLARTWGCRGCHADDLGGQVLIDAPPMGVLPAPNLTAGVGGLGPEYGLDHWVRAVRHGVGADGRRLMIMPSQDYAGMSDGDLGRILTWARATPPVDRELPPRSVGPVARALVAAGAFPLAYDLIDHARPPGPEPVRAATADYGAYLAQTCVGCHGPDLAGGPSPEPRAPPVPNITRHPDGLADWTRGDFERLLREGVRPDGTAVGDGMPWRSFQYLEDDEIEALWLYVQSVPARPDPEV